MSYSSINRNKTVRSVIVVCGLVFVAFCFLFLWRMQGSIISAGQYAFAHGQTSYNPIIGACITTFLLVLLQIGVQKMLHFTRQLYALSYLPSCVVLGFYTSFGPSIYSGLNFSWTWILMLVLLIVFCLLSKPIKRLAIFDFEEDDRNVEFWRQYGGNAIILAVLFGITACISNTNDEFHYDVNMQNYIVDGDMDAVLAEGSESEVANHDITAMRAFALSKKGELGERLFEYPQYYGSEGLLISMADTTHLLFSPLVQYRHLGALPRREHRTAIQYLEALNRHPQQAKAPVKHYLMCAYLLDKDIESFVSEFVKHYDVSKNHKIPKHYAEALLLYKYMQVDSVLVVYNDNEMESNYSDYRMLEKKYKNKTELKNRCREDFGKTYWWYYQYGKKD